MFPVQDEVVALLTEKDRGRLAKHDKGEAVAMLGAALGEELERIDAIRDCAPEKGEEVEDDRRLMRVREVELPDDVGGDGGKEDEAQGERDRGESGEIGQKTRAQAGNHLVQLR